MSRGVVIVDPYEAGASYARLFAARGFTCHRVMSSPRLVGEARLATLCPEEYATATDLSQGWEKALGRLRKLDLVAVLAGHEYGVPTADRLATALGLQGNSMESSAARRDKTEMAVRAGQAGLRLPAQQWGTTPNPLVDWALEHGRWPLIAKPASGYSSHQVERCATLTDLEQALARIFSEPNTLGESNTVALVQEYLQGPEYAVDTLSWEGEHQLTALWRYHRSDDRGCGPIHLFEAKELLPASGEMAERIMAYVRRLLDAFGIRFGPAHSELILVQGELVLVEVGARLHGGEAAHTICRLATGDSQLERTVRCFAHGGLDEAPVSPNPRSRAKILVLRNPFPGRVLDGEVQGRMAALPGVAEVRWNMRPGEPVPQIAGLALLVNYDLESLESTEKAVRESVRLMAADPASVPGRKRGRPVAKAEVSVLRERRALTALAAEWDDLLTRSTCNRAFSSARWFLSWCEVAPMWDPWVFTLRRQGNLAGVLSLVRDGEGPLHFPGTLADYQDAVVARGGVEVAQELLMAARETGIGLSLTGLRPDSSLALIPDRARFEDHGKEPCPHIDLSAGYQAFFSSRSTRFRNRLRRAWKRAAKAGLEVTELWPERLPPHELPALFLTLHGERFARSCFDRPLDRAFLTLALPPLFDERRLRAFALRRKGDFLAVSLCMVGSGSLGQWNGGWRPDAAPVSPGKLLLDCQIRTCCREGIAELDLMRGAEPYKAQWVNDERTTYTLAEAQR